MNLYTTLLDMTPTTPPLSKPAIMAAMTPNRTLPQNTPSQTSSPLIMHMRHMVAGIGGGVVSTLILHPLDLIKIRFQGKYICSSFRPAPSVYNGV